MPILPSSQQTVSAAGSQSRHLDTIGFAARLLLKDRSMEPNPGGCSMLHRFSFRPDRLEEGENPPVLDVE